MGNVVMEATQINYRRDEELKTVDQKLQELSQESAIDTDIAPVFKSTDTYNPGDLVYYRNKLYKCLNTHTGAWAAGDFASTDVSTALNAAVGALDATKADESNIAPAFDATASYEIGDLVYYGGTIYRCTNDHTGDWDAQDFSATAIDAELSELNSKLTAIGTILNGDHNTDRISVDTATATALGSVALTSGKWLLVATIDWASNDTGYRQIAFGSSINPARDGATTTPAMMDSGKETYQQLTRVYDVATAETVTLYGYQTSEATINAMPYIKAIKIS